MTDTVITKCFAYNLDGQRCQQAAGHDGLHAVVKEWSDDESWAPGATLTVSLKEYGPGEVEHLVDISDEELEESLGPVPIYGGEGRPGTCLLCSHAMHIRDCQNRHCDCRAGVPAG